MNQHQRDVALVDGAFTYDDGTRYHVVRRLSDAEPGDVGGRVYLVEHADGRREAKRESVMDNERPYKRHNGCLISADYQTAQADQRFGYVLEPVR